jgi:hypothetical protein
MVNPAQRGLTAFGILMWRTYREATMSDRSIHLIPKPDDSTVPAEIEQLENQEKLNRLADELGRANWIDGARLQPRSRYSYKA